MVSSDGTVVEYNEWVGGEAVGRDARSPCGGTRQGRGPMSATAQLEGFLVRAQLAEPGAPQRWSPLAGGASSDIWRVEVGTRSVCVKRALPQLKAAAIGHVPVTRNASEWAWLRFAHALMPQAVPEPLAHDEAAGAFAMGFLDPAHHPCWKQQLLAGEVDARTAAAVGRTLGALHDASAYRPDLARSFDSGQNFQALRLEPYLLTAAQHHRSVKHALVELVKRTASRRQALVHGDVCPENILVGPHGPVFLDAECAWYGDPAFDLAFCLNHLLLKRMARPESAKALAQSFQALVEGYFSVASFEDRAASESRAAHLLPALLLARVDGKAPVEYVTEEVHRDTIRAAALAWIRQPPPLLADIARPWFRC